MEHDPVEALCDKDDGSTGKEVTDSANSEIDVKDASNVVPISPRNDLDADIVVRNVGDVEGENSEDVDSSGEVNMEAFITPDDIIRAGGFGARDDISSFLPVASDSTDFEASIRDARGYEEPQAEVCRPGLGWKEASEAE